MPSRPANLAFSMHRCAMRDMEAIAVDSGYALPRHIHGQFGIGIVGRGAQKSFSGRGTVEAGVGDVTTVDPPEVHGGAPIGDADCVWCMPYLDPGVVAGVVTGLHSGHYGDAEFDRPVTRDATLASRVCLLFAQMTMPGVRNDALLCEQLLLPALADALHPANRPVNHHIDAVPDAVRLARIRIDNDPAAVISLLDFARETGLSRFQVLCGFAHVTGFTPCVYQVQRRAALTRRLIAQGESLVEVTATCGSADQGHMMRQFVREYGVSSGMVTAARQPYLSLPPPL